MKILETSALSPFPTMSYTLPKTKLNLYVFNPDINLESCWFFFFSPKRIKKSCCLEFHLSSERTSAKSWMEIASPLFLATFSHKANIATIIQFHEASQVFSIFFALTLFYSILY